MRYRRTLARMNPNDSPTSKILAEMFLYFARNPCLTRPGAYPISHRPSFVSCITLYIVFISGLHNVYFRKPTDVAYVDLSRFSLFPNNLILACFYTTFVLI